MQINVRILAVMIPCLAVMTGALALAGTQDDNRYDIAEIVEILEQKHSVRIFYEPQWFENETFSLSITRLPAEQAIMNIIRGRPLTLVDIDGYLVILPLDITEVSRDPDTLLLTIGDPSQFGRYNRAILSGRVLDGTTGDPLPGAVVYSENTGTGSPADSEGEFSLTLPTGELMLRLSFVGYEDQYRRINMMGPGSHDFYLFGETRRIDEVTIMARRAEENVSRTQMSVITMDARVLRQLPSGIGDRDILQSVTLMPGIQSTGEFGSGFHVRGGSNDQNLVMLEGMPLFNPSHLFGLVSVVNPDMISSMTMYKGGIPARYGERVSSVMDLRMNPGNIEEFKLIGGIGLINGRLHMELPVIRDVVSFSAGGRSSYSDWLLDRIPADELVNSSAGFYDISGALSIAPDRNSSISLFAYHSDDSFFHGEETHYNYGNTLASLRYNRVLSEKFSLNAAGGISNYDYMVRETGEIAEAESYEMNSSVAYRSIRGSLLWFPDGNHRVEFGMNAISYGINPGTLSPVGSGSQIEPLQIDRELGAELSLFASDEFEITGRLSTEVGLRYTRYLYLGPRQTYIYDETRPRRMEFITDTLSFSRNETVAAYGGLEPRISFRYSIDGSSSVKASYTRNNQYINLVSNTAVITPSDTWKLSDTHLKPLTSDQFAAGYFRNFADNMIETSAELYFRYLSNLTDHREGAEIVMNPNIETDLINVSGYSYGLELYAAKNSGRLTGWISYTLSAARVRSESEFEEDRINDNKWFPSNFDRPNELVINTGYNISRRWRIGATFNYYTGRPLTLPELQFPHGDRQLVYYSDRNKYRLPPYHRLDIHLSRHETLRINKRRSGYWTLSLLNVYGRKNPYSVFYERERAAPGQRASGFNLYKLYIIGRPVPTLTYNFRF